MKLPARRHELPNGLRWGVETIPYQSFHYHVLKHPLGVHRERNAAGHPQPWDREQWTALLPAALTLEERPRILEHIAAIRAGNAKCGVPEVHGAPAPRRTPSDFPCRACPRPVAVQCEKVLMHQHVVGQRYADVAEALVGDLADAVQVARVAFLQSVAFAARTNKTALATATVMSVGVPAQGSRTLARVSRGDGVRTELWLQGVDLHWRTTYRVPQGPTQSFLCELLPQSQTRASENCLVNRLWWESHGH